MAPRSARASGRCGSLDNLRSGLVMAVDLNADHLAAYVVDPSGNPVGAPHDIPIDLNGLPATTRAGRLKTAIAELLNLATANGCAAVAIENLSFADARTTGRETMGPPAGPHHHHPTPTRPHGPGRSIGRPHMTWFSKRADRPPLHEVGEHPGYRFSLANERTFLAWQRTGLAFAGVGALLI